MKQIKLFFALLWATALVNAAPPPISPGSVLMWDLNNTNDFVTNYVVYYNNTRTYYWSTNAYKKLTNVSPTNIITTNGLTAVYYKLPTTNLLSKYTLFVVTAQNTNGESEPSNVAVILPTAPNAKYYLPEP